MGRLAARRAVRRRRRGDLERHGHRGAQGALRLLVVPQRPAGLAGARRQRRPHGDLRAEGHRRPDGRGGLGHQPGEDPARLGRGEPGGRARAREGRVLRERRRHDPRAAVGPHRHVVRPERDRRLQGRRVPGGLQGRSARSTAAGPRPRRSPSAPSRATAWRPRSPRRSTTRSRTAPTRRCWSAGACRTRPSTSPRRTRPVCRRRTDPTDEAAWGVASHGRLGGRGSPSRPTHTNRRSR